MTNKVLITGANGLLGKRVINSLSSSYEVYAVVRSKPDDIIDGVTYLNIDLSSEWENSQLPKDMDIVIHLAQSSKFRDFPNQALDIFNVNINSTARLLDYAHKAGVKNFIYASSGGVYGTGSKAFDENSPITPSSDLGYYLGSKLCGEVLVQNYATLMNVITLRFFFMYGPEQDKSMLIPRLVENVKNGNTITLQSETGIKVNPVHVADATRAIEKVIHLDKSFAFNIAGAEILSLSDIANIIGKSLGKEPIFEIQNIEPNHLIADIGEMKNILGAPQISFEEGIEGFV